MNQGLKKASGDYIGIVESDDFVEPNMFEVLYSTAIKNNVEVVKSNFYGYLTKTGMNTKVIVIPMEDENKVVCPRKNKGIFSSMPCIWAAIYKRTFLMQHGIEFLPTPGASYQDTAFNFKIWAMVNKAYFLNDAFLHYRQDNENSSINSPGKVFCVCDEYYEIERFSREKQVYEELKYLIPRLKFATYRWNFERLVYPLNYKFLKVFSTEFQNHFSEQIISTDLFSEKLLCRLKKITYHPVSYMMGYYLKKFKRFIFRRK
jgi:glycosyltransferase involved in cell wall biosynthesis